MIKENIKSLLAQRVWMVASGIITLALIPLTLTPLEQGIFFIFLSFVAIQSIFEAGITSVFFNQVAHEVGLLKSINPPSEYMKNLSESRIHSLSIISRKWFSSQAIIFCVIVGIFGYYFILSNLSINKVSLDWEYPFVVLIFAISLALYNLSGIPIIEGHGHISVVANYRLRASVISSSCLWLGMIFGTGLWALAASAAIQSFVMFIQIFMNDIHRQSLRYSSLPMITDSTLKWRHEILPVQAKIAVSYFCGYIITQGIVPYTLQIHGPIVAGQVGLMTSAFNSIAALTSIYVYAAAPKYAEFIANKQWLDLRSIYTSVRNLTLMLSIAFYFAVWSFAYIAGFSQNWIAEDFLSRIPSLQTLFLMGAIGVANAYVGSAATVLRAQKTEPMMLISLIVAVGYALGMLANKDLSVEHLFFAFCAVQICVAWPMTSNELKKSGLVSPTGKPS